MSNTNKNKREKFNPKHNMKNKDKYPKKYLIFEEDDDFYNKDLDKINYQGDIDERSSK